MEDSPFTFEMKELKGHYEVQYASWAYIADTCIPLIRLFKTVIIQCFTCVTSTYFHILMSKYKSKYNKSTSHYTSDICENLDGSCKKKRV